MVQPPSVVITVLIVDDHPLVRAGTRHILDNADDISVVGEAATGAEAIVMLRDLSPDVVVVDIRLPDMSGIELIRQLVDMEPEVSTLVLSAFDNEDYIRAAFAAGALGYLLKVEPASDLVDAIRQAAKGEIIDHSSLPTSGADSPTGTSQTFTQREKEIIVLLAEGIPNKAIAASLGISRRTVEGHVSRIFAKAGTSSRTELLRWAILNGVVDLADPVR